MISDAGVLLGPSLAKLYGDYRRDVKIKTIFLKKINASLVAKATAGQIRP